MKMYDLGLVIGRFQLLHNGHKSMIENALNLCNRVVVYVGSAQEGGTERNPFTYYARRDMIEACFPVETKIGRIIVRPLNDASIGNNSSWGKYVLDTFEGEFNKQPDLYVTGCEKERPSWFAEKDAPNMSELRLSRSFINVSATGCRKLLLANDIEAWKQKVPYQLHGRFNFYKQVLEGVSSENISK